MPVGWQEGDAPAPAMIWTYPSEYETAKDYANDSIRDWNVNRFDHLSYLRWSLLWAHQGYALVHPDVPIVGDQYNDNYIQHLSDSLYATIREIDNLGLVDPDRVGHGGHSYGAFATGNLLTRTPYFKAGIAGDGAYNRTLTPMGFQSESRYLWQARETYLEMSPFFHADHLDTPLLMYHGGDDNNTGTFPIQSRRFIQALQGLDKNAVLYEYPFESHGPRAIESYLDLWKRFIEFFDMYVKNPMPAVEQE
jgi:dipeptidyl aminopeptidase/acylaminoacyl peptidase